MTSQHKTSGHWVELPVATIQRALVKFPNVVAMLAGWKQFDCSFWQTSACVWFADIRQSWPKAQLPHSYIQAHCLTSEMEAVPTPAGSSWK